jgi:hypothetical protein
MEYTTYSFLDLSGALAHPDLGAYVFTGQGVGSVTITMTTDKSAHDIAADGTIMVSKLAGLSGTVVINAQQTSAVHKFLLTAFNALYLAPTDSWANMSAFLRNTSDGTSHVLTGMSFGKVPDKPYAASGAQVAWTLWAADIQSVAA